MKTRSAKAKARRLQNFVRDVILALFPQFEPDDCKATPMGSAGVDIQLSPMARKQFPYSIEAKNVEKLNIWSALKQAESNCKENTTPLLVFRRNRTDAYVALPFENFIKLYARSIHEEVSPALLALLTNSSPSGSDTDMDS